MLKMQGFKSEYNYEAIKLIKNKIAKVEELKERIGKG